MKYLIAGFALLLVQSSIGFSGEKHPHGKPQSFLNLTDSIVVDYAKLDQMFLHPEVIHRKIVVVSIVGAFRKGKSFLMDYCLRFLYANYKSVNFMENPLNNKQEWMGANDEPLNGFSWRAGAARHTSGVVVWSDVFLHEINNEKLAIVLMDTQGLFDGFTSNADNSRIFALGTLLSSTQIFNLHDVIQEDQLAYLEAATSFAKFTLEEYVLDKESYSKPFQNLMFLMRDWVNNEDYNYGLAGGAQYINGILEKNKDQSPTLKSVRNYIKQSFDKIDCFLLPHPGLKILSSPNYNGSWSELEPIFKDKIEDLIETLLSPRGLKKKRIMGKEVTGKTFAEYATVYFKTFEAPSIVDPVSIYAVTLEKQLEGYTDQSMEFYKEVAKDFEQTSRPNFENSMEESHKQTKLTAVLMYKSFRKLGSTEYDLMYEKELEREIDLHYNLTKEILMDTHQKISQQEIRKADELNDETKVIEFKESVAKEIHMLEHLKSNSLEIVGKKVQNDRERRLVFLRQETEARRVELTKENDKREEDSIKEQDERIRSRLEMEKPILDRMDEKARETRINEIITLIRKLEQDKYLAEKREERDAKSKDQKAREVNRKQANVDFNREIANLQKLLGQGKVEPWLKNMCSDITGRTLCQNN